jgi:hypothetical protein
MSLQILGPKPYFWQWDSGQKLLVRDVECEEVHFCNGTGDCALVVPITKQENGDRVAEVPNILLQSAKPIRAHLYHRHDDGAETRTVYSFQVLPRTKPDGYVYTDTEVLTWESLDKRVKALEDGGAGGGGITKETDPSVPEWAKQPNPPEQPTVLPNPHKLTFTGAVEAEYDGSEAVEVKIPEGGSGGIEVTGAEVGQTIVVKAVDENGKPTEWECTNMPSDWELLETFELPEDTTEKVMDTTINFPEGYKDYLVIASLGGIAETSNTVLYLGVKLLNGSYANWGFWDYYPGEKAQKLSMYFESIDCNGDTYLRMSVVDATNVFGKPGTYKDSGWCMADDAGRKLKAWTGVRIHRLLAPKSRYVLYGRV